jgi:hypothetical protein
MSEEKVPLSVPCCEDISPTCAARFAKRIAMGAKDEVRRNRDG